MNEIEHGMVFLAIIRGVKKVLVLSFGTYPWCLSVIGFVGQVQKNTLPTFEYQLNKCRENRELPRV